MKKKLIVILLALILPLSLVFADFDYQLELFSFDPLYKEASYKPYIIAAMIFLAKFSDPSSKLQMLLDEAKPRIR